MKPLVLAGIILFAGGSALAKSPDRPDMTGKKEQSMANCPSAVAGANTSVKNRADGVELTVVATNAAARSEVQQRAKRQEEVAMQPERGSIEHTGEGTGSGRFGFCPGMIEGTAVTSEDLPDGARLTIRARDPSTVEKLQRVTAERLKALRASRR